MECRAFTARTTLHDDGMSGRSKSLMWSWLPVYAKVPRESVVTRVVI